MLIVVAGSVNIDRIWTLDRPLRPGARLRCLERHCRIGGGAANTGAALAELGCGPLIVSRITIDAAGDGLMRALQAFGLDVTGVERVDGVARPAEILVTPDGERTLIGNGARPRTLPAGLARAEGAIVYVNLAPLADPEALRPMLDRRWLVAQMPLAPDEPRPAHVLIASRSDVEDAPRELLWQRRRALDGAALRFLIITDGPRGAALVDATGAREIPCVGPPVAGDTTGAGDFFAAGLLDALARDASPEDAVRHGHATAARFLASKPALLSAPLRACADEFNARP